MSGHSHAKTVMRTKQASDAKRSQVFSKLAKELTVAAKEGGADPDANPRLRTVIEKAKEANMPSDNVERAIKKATGADAGQLEEILIEAYGPGNVALLIAAITDNKNRTAAEVKQIIQKHKGKAVEGGAVRWLFERKGVATFEAHEDAKLPSKEELELLCIEAGAEDLCWKENTLEAYLPPPDLSAFTEKLKEHNLPFSASLQWVPKERTATSETDQKAIEKLSEALREQDDVQEIYSTL